MTPTPHTPARRSKAAGVCLLIVLAAVPGCRGRALPSTEAPTLRIGFGMGPTARANGVNVIAAIVTSEPLVIHDWQGRPTPGLAASWEWADDRTRLTLNLKPGVRLHDGSALTAGTVAGFLRSQHDTGGNLGFRDITEITAPNDSTVVIRLSRPDAFLLPELSDLRIVHPDVPDVATGPFRLTSRSPVVEASRFDEYHGGVSKLGGIRISTYDTHRAAWAALMRGEVDVVQEVTRDSVEFMERSSNVKTYSSIQPFYIYLAFNQRHPAMRKVEVRRAMSEALDRQDIIERAMRGRGRVADGPIWPFHWAYTPPAARYVHDPDHAQTMLDAAGLRLPESKGAGERRVRFSFSCLVWSEDPQYERIALMAQRQLSDIGIDMKIELLPLDAFAKRAKDGEFDAYLMQANASRSLNFTYRFWRSTGPENNALQNSGYTGADQLLDAVRRSPSDDQLRTALAALSRRFYDDPPAAFIAWTEVTRAVSTRFNVGDNTGQDPFANIWQWQPTGAQPDR